MEQIQNMNSMPVVVSGEGCARGRVSSGSVGEGTQQRFAEVLPLAEAALDESSAEEAELYLTTDDGSCETPDVKADCPALEEDETQLASSNMEAVEWLLAATVPLMTQPQTESAVAAPAPGATLQMQESVEVGSEVVNESVVDQRMPVSESVTIPAEMMGAPQVFDEEELVDAGSSTQAVRMPQMMPPESAADETTASASEMWSDTAVSTRDADDEGNAVAPTAMETARSTPVVGEGPAPQPQLVREAMPADVPGSVQTTQDAAPVGQTDVQIEVNEQPQTPPSTQTASDIQAQVPSNATVVENDSAEQTVRQETAEAVKPTSGDQSSADADDQERVTDGQTSAPAQRLGRDTISTKSENNGREHSLLSDERQSDASTLSDVAPSGDAKTTSVRSGGSDADTVGTREAATILSQQSATAGGETTVVPQRLATQSEVQPQMSAETSAARTEVQSVGQQILDSVQASAARGDRQILVRLTPPELGTVLVRFQEQGQNLVGTLEVSNQDARREIEQALPQVARALQEAGVQVRRIEVVASDPSQRDSSHLTGDAWSQHQGMGQGREQSYSSSQMRWSQEWGERGAARRSSEAQSQTRTAQGELDLLL